jgi:Winged helix DNA-binding domain
MAERVLTLRELFCRYLAAFGPASIADFQTWSGLTRLKEPLEKLRSEFRTYRDEQSIELFDLTDISPEFEDIATPVRFLPEYDNLILSHANRARFVNLKYRTSIFLSAARVRATFLVDGFTAGVWKVEKAKKKATLIIEPFEPLSKQTKDALAEEGEPLIRFIEEDAQEYEVRFTD